MDERNGTVFIRKIEIIGRLKFYEKPNFEFYISYVPNDLSDTGTSLQTELQILDGYIF